MHNIGVHSAVYYTSCIDGEIMFNNMLPVEYVKIEKNFLYTTLLFKLFFHACVSHKFNIQQFFFLYQQKVWNFFRFFTQYQIV